MGYKIAPPTILSRPAVAGLRGWLPWKSDEEELRDIVLQFPDSFDQIQADWAAFKLGYEKGLFSESDAEDIRDWYGRLPELWAMIKPNWTLPDPTTGLLSAHKVEFGKKADAWIKTLGEEPLLSGLGIAPLIVLGVFIAVGLLVGGIWAIAYWKDKENMHDLIQARTAGQISESEFKAAVAEEKTAGGSFWDKLVGIPGNLATVAVIGAVVYFAGPQLQKLAGKVKL